jgi:transposase InsO family protein
VKLEGAGGNSIPYSGYTVASIQLDGFEPLDVPVLVVKDTPYHSKVPLLVGTNVYSRLVRDPSKRIINERMTAAIQTVNLVQRHLQKSEGKYGTMYAAHDFKLKPGATQTITAVMRITVPIPASVALITSPEKHNLEVTPGVVNLKHGANDITVEVQNPTAQIRKYKKGQLIAHASQIALTENSEMDENDTLLNKFDLTQLENEATPEEISKIRQFIIKWRKVFSNDSSDLGKTAIIKHRIDLHDDVPIKEKARRIPPTMVEELRQHIRQLKDMGVIEESVSPWSSPIVLVRKKSGELRLCVDYRKLNAKTIKDSYRIPTIEELIETLGGATWFATLDLSSGYHQVEIEESHRERTAFTAGPLGFYQYRRMPFGLTNAPSLFQRMMERVLSGSHLNTCLVYLDDIICFGKTIAELHDNMHEVFAKIHQAGLKLKAEKCHLFHRKLKYLGHVVSEHGVQCDPDMISTVKDWKTPENVKELQTFLGFANFYRRFIQGFANIAEPLNALLGENKNTRGSKTKKPWVWGKQQQSAFDKLRTVLTSPPVLSYPDFTRPFIVRTDASTSGLGAVLCQDFGDKEGPRVIAYASRSLKPSERHYSPYKLEFLALYWAVTKKLKPYLHGTTNFTVTTDHNPLTYILTSAKLDSTGHRWLADLTNFNFDIEYKPGKHNGDADALSRMNAASVRAACEALAEDQWEDYAPNIFMEADSPTTQCQSVISGENVDWGEEQSKDPTIRRVKYILSSGVHVKPSTEKSPVIMLLRHRKRLDVIDGTLLRVTRDKKQVILPSHLKEKILTMTHTDMGHQGRDRTLALCQERFYWTGMAKDIQLFITSCNRCNRSKAPHLPEKAPLHPIQSMEPLELVCMDYLSLEPSKGGYHCILVITDHFTKYAVAIPTSSQTAHNTANLLLQHFIYRFGIPRRLHSDQGGSFEAKIIKQLCEAHGIKKSRTTPYHPESDGITERFNSTLLNMLRTLDNSSKADWKSHVQRLVHAYNCTPHKSTSYSPYFLMFGRHPRLPTDTLFDDRVPEEDVTDFAQKVRKRLQDAFEVAAKTNDQARKAQKNTYDSGVRGIMPDVGDFVLVRKLGLKGKHKIADRWEDDVYIITKRDPDLPFYTVRKDKGKGKERVLHRNHLLPVTWPISRDLNSNETNRQHAKTATGEKDQSGQVDDGFLQVSDDSIMEQVNEVEDHESTDTHSELSVTQDPENGTTDAEHTLPVAEKIPSRGELHRNTSTKRDNTLDYEDTVSSQSSDESDVEELSDNEAEEFDNITENQHDPEVQSESNTVDEDEANKEQVEITIDEDRQPLRRSCRERRKPDWYMSGTCGLKQQTVIPDWQQKCEFLLKLLDKSPGHDRDIMRIMLDIISRT